MSSIASGTLKFGDRLPPDREIGMIHNVSRATAREALLALELMGAVDIQPGKGVYVCLGGTHVSALDATKLPYDLVETRLHFEPIVSRMAATLLPEEAIRQLQDELEEAKSLLQEDSDVDRFMSLNINLHVQLAGGCGNSLMAGIVTDLVNVESHPLWHLINRQVNSTVRERELQITEHERILTAVAQRNPELAYQEMSTHLVSVRDTLFGGEKPPPN